MTHSSFTAQAITAFTKRQCIRFTELAYVVVAVFAEGRPQFISKKALYEYTVRQECRNGARLSAEWSVGLTYKPQPCKIDTAVIAKRVERAGFQFVTVYGREVTARLPKDEFDAEVARQIAKENGWTLNGNNLSIAA